MLIGTTNYLSLASGAMSASQLALRAGAGDFFARNKCLAVIQLWNKMRTENIVKDAIPPLPLTIRSFLKRKRTINDDVEEAFMALLKDEKTREKLLPLIGAIFNSQAVEGLMAIDDYRVSDMIRQWAREEEKHELASQNLASIMYALRIVMKRCKISRRQRREEYNANLGDRERMAERRAHWARLLEDKERAEHGLLLQPISWSEYHHRP